MIDQLLLSESKVNGPQLFTHVPISYVQTRMTKTDFPPLQICSPRFFDQVEHETLHLVEISTFSQNHIKIVNRAYKKIGHIIDDPIGSDLIQLYFFKISKLLFQLHHLHLQKAKTILRLIWAKELEMNPSVSLH